MLGGRRGSGGLRSLSLNKPARLKTRLTVALETPTYKAMCACSISLWRNSTITNATLGWIYRRLRAGRQDLSSTPTAPSTR
jgi:hypothetical protein